MGKIAEAVSTLASALVKAGVLVDIVTFHENLRGIETAGNGIRISRVSNPVSPHINILTWALNTCSEFQRAIGDSMYSSPPINLIDVHEWHGVPAAVAGKKAFGLPMVYTVYSLEKHRSLNPEDPLSLGIGSIEWLGAYEAGVVVARSEQVMSDLTAIHRVPATKIRLIEGEDSTAMQEILSVYREVSRNG